MMKRTVLMGLISLFALPLEVIAGKNPDEKIERWLKNGPIRRGSRRDMSGKLDRANNFEAGDAQMSGSVNGQSSDSHVDPNIVRNSQRIANPPFINQDSQAGVPPRKVDGDITARNGAFPELKLTRGLDSGVHIIQGDNGNSLPAGFQKGTAQKRQLIVFWTAMAAAIASGTYGLYRLGKRYPLRKRLKDRFSRILGQRVTPSLYN